MKRIGSLALVALAPFAVLAADNGARMNFLAQQAHDEVRRVSAQVDAMQNNIDDISQRLMRLERGNNGGEVAALRSRIAALEGQLQDMKRQLSGQRAEIVGDLTKRISKMQTQVAPPAPKPVVKTLPPHREYVVKSGDTLSLIAEAFGTTVSKLREMNTLKGNTLRIGQKINVPLK